jgi:hypothetical protein
MSDNETLNVKPKKQQYKPALKFGLNKNITQEHIDEVSKLRKKEISTSTSADYLKQYTTAVLNKINDIHTLNNVIKEANKRIKEIDKENLNTLKVNAEKVLIEYKDTITRLGLKADELFKNDLTELLKVEELQPEK